MSVAISSTQKVHLPDKVSRFVGTMTLEQYRKFEQDDSSNQRYEFQDGKVFRVAGASPEHNRISRNILIELEISCRREKGICEALSSDQKVFVRSEKYVYPDACLVCGDAQFDFNDALRNPYVIIEVLSPSTERDDRTDKFREYQKIESLRHYILIDQNRVSVLHYEKLAIGLWAIVGDYTSLDNAINIIIDGANLTVALSQIYYGVEFPEDAAESSASS